MHLIIIGASARAAAFSAHRAGLKPWCVDLFADADLACRFPVRKVPLHAYPDGILDALRDAPDGPVLYTGGLENHPDLLARIDRPLWGNPPEVLRRVRDPFLVTDVLRRHGLPVLDVRAAPPTARDRRQWLLKPLRGSGGLGIRHYSGGTPFDPKTHYLQELAAGWCFGATFLGLPEGHALLLGVTGHIHAPWVVHAPAFHYCGSFGPLAVNPGSLPAMGDLLTREFSLRGIFGIDAVYHSAPAMDKPAYLLLEVNPRYTASIEIIERGTAFPFLDLHRAVYENRVIRWPAPLAWSAEWAKGVLYAAPRFHLSVHGPVARRRHLDR